jgi:hypothetical protein
LNDSDSYPPNISATPSTLADVNSRAFPRVITEVPPPSQLDIEWSPVLSKTSERMLNQVTSHRWESCRKFVIKPDDLLGSQEVIEGGPTGEELENNTSKCL